MVRFVSLPEGDTVHRYDPVGKIQMPVFACCFLVFLQEGKKCYSAMERGLTACFYIITISVLLSVLTGTYAQTYSFNGFGVLGWFSNTNAQSAILGALSLHQVFLCLRGKSLPRLTFTTAAAFLQLYFLGTRLAFATIILIALGGILSMALCRDISTPKVLILGIGLLACLLTVRLSPMYQNQHAYTDSMAEKQGWEAQIYENAKTDIMDNADEADSEEVSHQALKKIYEFYAPVICHRFGTETIMEAYGYTQDVRTITAARPQKILYCKLLLREYPFAAKLFGMELTKMTYEGSIFDVENDLHGMFFLYGGVGLSLMILFLLYFVIRMLLYLLPGFPSRFTMELAGVGLAICVQLAYTCFTAGMLRRPEASFYLSVMLALGWYLTRKHTGNEEVPS